MKITPGRAIKIECGVCNRDRGPCMSRHCALKNAGMPLERIKNHCRACAPDHRTEDCTGQIIGTQAQALHDMYQIPIVDGKAQCPLWPFRYGKNPNIGRSLSDDQKKANAVRLQSYRFQKKETFSPVQGVEQKAGAEIGAI